MTEWIVRAEPRNPMNPETVWMFETETEARAQMNLLDTPKDHMLYRTIKLIESSILGNYLKGEYQF